MQTISIKLKAALATTGLSLAFIAVATVLVLNEMRTGLREVMTGQQSALVTQTADEIDERLHQDLEIVSRVAATITQAQMRAAPALRAHLEGLPTLSLMFDDVVVMDRDGQVIADVPQLPGRVGVNAADRPYFRQIMATGIAIVSEPVLGKRRRQPTVNLGAAIRAADGSIIGVLTGVLRLEKHNLLGAIADAYPGLSGYLFVITRDPQPVYVAHRDKIRILTAAAPAAGGAIARALRGFEGTLEDTDADGVPAMFSFRALRVTNWVLVSVLPVAEAFGPIQAAERTVIGLAGLLAAIAVASAWLVMYGLLAPLTHLHAAIRQMRRREGVAAALPVRRPDEIGEVAAKINLLVDARADAERRERQSAARFRAAADSSIDAFFMLDAMRDADGRIVDFMFRFANAEAAALVGRPGMPVEGRRLSEVWPLHGREALLEHYVRTMETAAPLDLEFEFRAPQVGGARRSTRRRWPAWAPPRARCGSSGRR